MPRFFLAKPHFHKQNNLSSTGLAQTISLIPHFPLQNEVNEVEVNEGIGLLRLFRQKNEVFINGPADTPTEKYLCRYYWSWGGFSKNVRQ